MKGKYFCAAGLAVLFAVLFLPVWYCVIFIGNDMLYNEEHKIETLCSNELLFVYAIFAAVCVVAVCLLFRKIPYNRYTVWGGTVAGSAVFCVIHYFVQVKISECIMFYGGWDCGMVANSARWLYEGEGLGYGDYYTVYTNNVPITWLLYKLYGIAVGMGEKYPYNPEFIWVQFQCMLFSVAVFLAAMTTLVAVRKIGPTILTLLVNGLLLGFTPWKTVPYTDASTIAMPILVLFLYVLYLRTKSKLRYGLWFLLLFAGLIGGMFKATCYICLIAVLAVDVLWVLFEGKTVFERVQLYAERLLVLICAYILALCCKNGIYKTLDYEYDRDIAITWTNYLYNGLNELTTGACSGDGLSIVYSYGEYPREVRDAVEWQYIKDRIREKGGKGLLDFWLRKQVMNFNDGTFSWFQEGCFNVWEYEEITQSSWKEPLRAFYWEEGESYLNFTTFSQGLWFFILLGIVAEAIQILVNAILAIKGRGMYLKKEPETVYLQMAELVFFIGIFLFVMLFEGRARYLFNSVSALAWISVMGYYGVSECFQRKK